MRSSCLRMCLISILFVGGPASSCAADEPDVVAILADRDSTWNFDHKENAGDSVTYHFERQDARLVISVKVGQTSDEAQEQVEKLTLRITAQSVAIPGIGDLCRSWSDPQSGATTIVLCRGNVTIHLVAPSLQEATTIATYLDEALTAPAD